MTSEYRGLLLSGVGLVVCVVMLLLLGESVNLWFRDGGFDRSMESVLGVVEETGTSDEFYVLRVIDGDTIVLEDESRVRYIGVDTPETVKPGTEVECFGKEASEFNRSLVEGKMVRLEKDVNETDRNGRLLRYVWVEQEVYPQGVPVLEWIMVNEVLVREGYAVASAYPPDVKYQDRLDALEAQARDNGRGLWSTCTN